MRFPFCVRCAPLWGVALLSAGALHAAGQVSGVETSDQPGTLFQYSAGGNEYAWGLGRNQVIDAFTLEGRRYSFGSSADRVEIVRDEVPGVATGEPCGVFVETLNGQRTQFEANYPVDTSNRENCDMADLLRTRIINRGALNLFNNVPPGANNIERVDYVFDNGISTPLSPSAMAFAGHMVAEKSGNNPVKVAAILELDILGQPARFGPLVTVREHYARCDSTMLCYGLTDLMHDYAFLASNSVAPQSFPVFLRQLQEPVAIAFVSAAALGLAPEEQYFGLSYFADDIDVNVHDLTDVSTFPDDTVDSDLTPGDDADIYGGVSGYFVADAIVVGLGAVFLDKNEDGVRGTNEAGLAGIGLTLYQDSNDNGILDIGTDTVVGTGVNTNLNGEFLLPGLDSGSYFVLLDENDADIPGGLELPSGSNPLAFVVNGVNPDPLNFAFLGTPGNGAGTGGDTDGSGTDGDTTGGTETDGGTTDGSDTDGGSTDGSGTDGTTDGTETDGGSTDGSDTDGATTDGSGTDGGTTDGTETDGESTDGSDTDGATTDGSDTDGGTTDGSVTDGGTTDGSGTDGVATDGSGTDGGTTDGNGTDGVTTDGSATDGGTTDGSGTDGGTTDGTTTDGSPDEDDPVTAANDDDISIRQDTTATIDALANDTDASGGGLTIIEVSDSPNDAEIQTDGNQIEYNPDFGFIGEDSFTYTIRDADGETATGTVTVNVTRFSDINNDGINDFDQCNCDNLTLETGVHGAGIGKVWPLSLFVLTVLVFARYRSRLSRRRVGGIR